MGSSEAPTNYHIPLGSVHGREQSKGDTNLWLRALIATVCLAYKYTQPLSSLTAQDIGKKWQLNTALQKNTEGKWGKSKAQPIFLVKVILTTCSNCFHSYVSG